MNSDQSMAFIYIVVFFSEVVFNTGLTIWCLSRVVWLDKIYQYDYKFIHLQQPFFIFYLSASCLLFNLLYYFEINCWDYYKFYFVVFPACTISITGKEKVLMLMKLCLEIHQVSYQYHDNNIIICICLL